jgi:hypothetical protein
MSSKNLEAGIPILTEVIETPGESESLAEPEVTSALPSPLPSSLPVNEPVNPVPVTSAAPAQLTSEQLQQIEGDISKRVLQQLFGHIDLVLEQRVRDSLADVLQLAVSGLATEIRQGLHQTLEEVIARAVSKEIARLQSTKK